MTIKTNTHKLDIIWERKKIRGASSPGVFGLGEAKELQKKRTGCLCFQKSVWFPWGTAFADTNKGCSFASVDNILSPSQPASSQEAAANQQSDHWQEHRSPGQYSLPHPEWITGAAPWWFGSIKMCWKSRLYKHLDRGLGAWSIPGSSFSHKKVSSCMDASMEADSPGPVAGTFAESASVLWETVPTRLPCPTRFMIKMRRKTWRKKLVPFRETTSPR